MSNVKQEVYDLFMTGDHTKAGLGREFEVSARTIGRWIDEVQAQIDAESQTSRRDESIETFLCLVAGDVVKFTNVMSNLPFSGLDSSEFYEGVTARVSDVTSRGEGYVLVSFMFQVSDGECEREQVSSQEFIEYGFWDIDVVEEIDDWEEPLAYTMPETYLSVIMTDSYLSIGADGKVDTITTDHPRFDEFYRLIQFSGMSQQVLAEVRSQMTVKNIIESFEYNTITVDVESEQVMYKGEPVHGVVVQRILDSMHNSNHRHAMESLVKFLDHLMENPSYRAVNELYSFLEAADIKIDSEGYVVCFKKVTGDYKDIRTQTFDNSVGSTPTIERNMVDEDMNRTCSHGLHVCSQSYLPHFGSCYSNRVVKVRVNPADFVSIPTDYNFAKARVCRYEVLEDVTEQYYNTTI